MACGVTGEVGLAPAPSFALFLSPFGIGDRSRPGGREAGDHLIADSRQWTVDSVQRTADTRQDSTVDKWAPDGGQEIEHWIDSRE